MTFRYRKSIRLGKGVRINLSKTGIGLSAGIPGFRYSVHSSGRTTRSVGVPGTGMYFRKDTALRRSPSTGRTPSTSRRTPPPVVTSQLPHAGFLAPKGEKAFVKGIAAYTAGNLANALEHFYDCMDRDTANKHISEEYFAAFTLLALDRVDEAIALLERVLASAIRIPDWLMDKYHISGQVEVQVTPSVVVELPSSNLAAGLLLAELYQHHGDVQKAIDLLESLGSVAPDSVFALSLAELYMESNKADAVLRVSEGFNENVDDATCQLLVFKAGALHDKGLNDGALEVLREALRSRKRQRPILLQARYVRGLAYEATGKMARAKQEWERIYAENPSFADVGQRLGQTPNAPSSLPPARPDKDGMT
jgi:tetratricopeptide (TPR) repeat protein